jgi:hypothetical protein
MYVEFEDIDHSNEHDILEKIEKELDSIYSRVLVNDVEYELFFNDTTFPQLCEVATSKPKINKYKTHLKL